MGRNLEAKINSLRATVETQQAHIDLLHAEMIKMADLLAAVIRDQTTIATALQQGGR